MSVLNIRYALAGAKHTRSLSISRSLALTTFSRTGDCFRLPNRREIGLSKYVIPLLTKMSSTIFVIPYCLRRGRPMYLSKKYQYYLKVVCYYQRFLLCYSWYKPPFFWFSANSIITKTECLYLFIFGFLCIFNLIQHKFRLRSMRYIQHRKMGRLW